MFISLLVVTFAIALVVSFVVARLFRSSIEAILQRIVTDELSRAWQRYVTFAIYVVGVSGGVRLHQLERYITSFDVNERPLVLTGERWTLEVYRTIIETLQSIAWMLLVFFAFALVAYVVVRAVEWRRGREDGDAGP